MTERQRREVADYFRRTLDLVGLTVATRKEAMFITCNKFKVDRATIYRYCARFHISTK